MRRIRLSAVLIIVMSFLSMFVCLSGVSLLTVYRDPYTGSLRYVKESFVYFPYFGKCALSSTEWTEPSHFKEGMKIHCLPVNCWRRIENKLFSANIWYRWQMREDYQSFAFDSERTAVPFFLNLYNSDEQFRRFIEQQFLAQTLSRDWFLNIACARGYACGTPSIDLLSHEAKVLFSYRAATDW